MKEIKTKQEFVENVSDLGVFDFKGDNNTILDFHAPWCGPCKTIGPILEDVSKSIDGLDVYKINVDELGEIAQMFNVRSIPTIIYIRKDGNKTQTVGSIDKASLTAKIKNYFEV